MGEWLELRLERLADSLGEPAYGVLLVLGSVALAWVVLGLVPHLLGLTGHGAC